MLASVIADIIREDGARRKSVVVRFVGCSRDRGGPLVYCRAFGRNPGIAGRDIGAMLRRRS